MDSNFIPLQELANAKDQGTNLTSSQGTVLPATSADSTKGAWGEIVASTPYEACAIDVAINCSAYTSNNASVDIGIGAAGSESVFLADLMVMSEAEYASCPHYHLPIRIPAGTRLSGRMQVTSTSEKDTAVNVTLFQGGYQQHAGYPGLDTIGFVPANTSGTVVAGAATANTKSAWVELSASLDHDLAAWCFHLDQNTTKGGSALQVPKLIDIGIGPSGSEVAILPNYQVSVGSGTSIWVSHRPELSPVFFIPIKKGTRLVARTQTNSTDGHLIDTYITFYGVQA